MVTNLDFQLPIKRIKNSTDLARFQKSLGRNSYLSFLESLNSAVCGLKNSDITFISRNCRNVLHVLSFLSITCKEYDFLDRERNNARYGSSAFRDWYSGITNILDELLIDILPSDMKSAHLELLPYFLQSFGEQTRLDYGTGHEASFIAFLACLKNIGFFKKSDHASLVTCVFKKYVEITRQIQKKFRLEPAGSLGVWGIDDYCFIPFLWGASQLIFTQQAIPLDIVSERTYMVYEVEYLFFSSITYIRQKREVFSIHPLFYLK